MELQKGICFLCRNVNVVKPSQSQEAYKIITLLFPKEILNHTEFNNVQTALGFCPLCYHKLIILKRTSENVKVTIPENISSSSCILCKSEKNLFQVNDWPGFNAISEDIAFSKNNNCVTCSDCLFYLETKNELKTKLFSKYPKLRMKPLNNNKRKWKVRCSPKIKLSSLLSDKKKQRASKKRKLSEMMNSSSSADDSMTEKSINFDSLKKLRPLRDNKQFRKQKKIKTDSKFLNQIPYVLVNILDFENLHKSTFEEDEVKCNEKEVFKETPIQSTVAEETGKIIIKNEKLITKSRNDLHKQSVEKQLVVNITRMRIEKYLEKESSPDLQNLNEKSNIPDDLNRTDPNESTTDISLSLQDSLVEEVDTSFEVKSKRKSVSFAEERNIEIEYFENDPNISFRNSNLAEDFSDVIGKKYSKGILKRDEQNTPEKQNKQLSEEPMEEDEQEVTEDHEDEDTTLETVENKITNKSNDLVDDNKKENDISDSDNEGSVKVVDNSDEPTHIIESDDAKEDNEQNKEGNEENIPKLPLRKKRRSTVVIDRSVDENEEKSMESNNFEVATEEQSAEDKSKEEEENICESTTDIESCQNEDHLKDIPKSVSEEHEVNTVESENINTITDTDDLDSGEPLKSKQSKRHKPRPLSKKKKLNGKLTIKDKEISPTKDLDNGKIQEEEEPADEQNLEQEKDTLTPLTKDKSDEKSKDENEFSSEDENFNNSEVLGGQACTDLSDIVASIDTEDDKEKDTEEDRENINDIVDKSTEVVSNTEEEVSCSNLDKNSSPSKSTTVLETCEEVLKTDDTNSESIEKDSSLIENEKSVSISDNDPHLVDKYLIDEDDGTFINTQNSDVVLKKAADINFSRDSDEELTQGNNVDNDSKKTDDSLHEFDKNEDLGISETDNDNINSILSHIFPEELPDDKLLFEANSDSTNGNDSSEDANSDFKIKISDNELNVIKEKKKKKVTFCEDVT